jgi:hypothetical protein
MASGEALLEMFNAIKRPANRKTVNINTKVAIQKTETFS